MSDGYEGPREEIPAYIAKYVNVARIAGDKILAKNRISKEQNAKPEIGTHFSLLMHLASLKSVATHMKQAAMVEAVQSSIREVIDDYCGTPPQPIPLPHHIAELAVAISLAASSVNNANISGTLTSIATDISSRII